MTYMKIVAMQMQEGQHQCKREISTMWEGSSTNVSNSTSARKATKRLFIFKQPMQEEHTKKNNFMKKTKPKFHFIIFPLSLILNSTSTSIGSG